MLARLHAAALVATLMVLASVARAAVPEDVSLQGRLLSLEGQPIPGPVDLRVRVFEEAVEGTLLYSEAHLDVPLADGVFQILLGTGTDAVGAFDALLFAESERWLELEVDDEVLAPRQPFSSVPFAFHAGMATSATSVGTIPASEVATTADLAVLQAQIEALQTQVQGLLCGNGVLDAGEECDPPNGATCSAECLRIPSCGDDVLDEGEECDDGNLVDGDGCSSTCTEENFQTAPPDATFNNPLNIPLDNTVSVLDFVSFPDGDTEDRVRYDVTGMNPNPSLSGGRARLVISASCFGTNTDQIQFFTNSQTFSCGQTVVDREVTEASATGTITITAVGGVGTYVQWVLTGTATRVN